MVCTKATASANGPATFSLAPMTKKGRTEINTNTSAGRTFDRRSSIYFDKEERQTYVRFISRRQFSAFTCRIDDRSLVAADGVFRCRAACYRMRNRVRAATVAGDCAVTARTNSRIR